MVNRKWFFSCRQNVAFIRGSSRRWCGEVFKKWKCLSLLYLLFIGYVYYFRRFVYKSKWKTANHPNLVELQVFLRIRIFKINHWFYFFYIKILRKKKFWKIIQVRHFQFGRNVKLARKPWRSYICIRTCSIHAWAVTYISVRLCTCLPSWMKRTI